MDSIQRKRPVISVTWPTKAALDQIKHPGQSYNGLVQELIRFWKSEHGIEETDQEASAAKRVRGGGGI